jgi:hypothetical protein
MTMKFLGLLLVLPTVAMAQAAPSVITFNRGDTEHCRVLVASGKPLLATTYQGTTVAVSLPENWLNGEYSVFVMVSRSGEGKVDVNPKDFYALFSDPGHTRFAWFDKKHDLETLASMRAQGMGQTGGAGAAGGPGGFGGSSNGDSAGAGPPPTHPEVMAMGQIQNTNPGTRSEAEARNMELRSAHEAAANRPQLDPAHPPVFLKHTSVKAGADDAGYVFFKKPKGFGQEITGSSALGEIDIPVNGVIYRF